MTNPTLRPDLSGDPDLSAPFDVAVVGAGVAGGAVATTLARGGLRVLLLERTARFEDIVRGEWIAPWGVQEIRQLGLYEHYVAHGAHPIQTHANYCDTLTPADALRFDIGTLCGYSRLPLGIPHAGLCTALATAAQAAGAVLLRGVRRTHVTPGVPPHVRFEHEGRSHDITPRLVVGADGRNGFTARQIGVTMHEDPPRHLLAGLLVEGADDWPSTLQCSTTEGDLHAQVYPLGDGRARLYAAIPLARRGWLLGPQGPETLLQAFRLSSVPESAALQHARPAGPCHVYPNHDSWSDAPCAPGCVLVGDAAGRNDPTAGQGLALCHYDARTLAELLLGNPVWDAALLHRFADAHNTVLERLRVTGRVFAAREASFGDAGGARRQRMRARASADPLVAALAVAPLVGPLDTPAEAFSAHTVARALG